MSISKFGFCVCFGLRALALDDFVFVDDLVGFINEDIRFPDRLIIHRDFSLFDQFNGFTP